MGSQHEMRGCSEELLRRVAEGESVLVTNNGVPVAVVVPVATDTRTRLIKAGRLRVGTGLDLSALASPPQADPAAEDQTEEFLADDRGE
jgi:prevent-host-death family protein